MSDDDGIREIMAYDKVFKYLRLSRIAHIVRPRRITMIGQVWHDNTPMTFKHVTDSPPVYRRTEKAMKDNERLT
jgi:hypothetical protein